MKTKIITLETFDDLISVRDRLSWAKTARILLVWPKYEDVSLRFLDLKVLQRHAESLGAQLALVTRRVNVRREAEALGLPVFESTRQAQKEAWPAARAKSVRSHRPPRKDLRSLAENSKPAEAKWRSSWLVRMLAFTAGVSAVLCLAATFLPRAVVTLYPTSQVQQLTIPVIAGPAISAVSVTGAMPAYPLSIVITDERTQPVSSRISMPESKASGIARFTNLTDTELEIPSGTVVSAPGQPAVRFITKHATTLTAGLEKFVDVPIEAMAAGESGNLEAGTIQMIEGNVGLSAMVRNPGSTTGGSDTQTIGPTETDRTRLREELLEDLEHEAEKRLRVQAEAKGWFLPDTLGILQIIEETYSPVAGAPGKSLSLRMRVEFGVRYIKSEDLNQLGLTALNTTLPSGFLASEPPELTLINEPLTELDNLTHFDLKAGRTLLLNIDTVQANELVRGQRIERAGQKLAEELTMRALPDIEIFPSFWPWMPLVPFNISVRMK